MFMTRNSLGLGLFILALIGLSVTENSPVQASFKPQVQHVQVGDVSLAYYTRGEGKPLVMINGFISTMSLWDPLLIEELAKTRKLILFDNRGVGLSTDTIENNTTIPQMADDTAGLITALGLEKPDILGWSMGARIAQQLLIRHPDLVGRAVLAAPNPGGSHGVPADKDVEDKLNDPSIPIDQKFGLLVPPGPESLRDAQKIFDRIQEAAKQGTAPNDFDVSNQTAERQDRARTTLWNADDENYNKLKDISNPVLVTDGRFDVVDKPINSVIIASQIPFAWLAFFDGGHAFLFEQHEKFAATLEVFLN